MWLRGWACEDKELHAAGRWARRGRVDAGYRTCQVPGRGVVLW